MDDNPSPPGWLALLRAIRPLGTGSLVVTMMLVIILKGAQVEVILSLTGLMLAAIILVLVTRGTPGAL